MDTKQALRELSVTDDLTTSQKRQLDEQGFFIAEGVLSSEECRTMSDRVRAHPCGGARQGRP